MIRTRPVTFARGVSPRARRRSGKSKKRQRDAQDSVGQNKNGRKRGRVIKSKKNKKKKERNGGGMSRTRRLLNASRTNLPRRVRGAINIRRIRGRSVVRLV